MTDLERDARRWSYVRKYLARAYGLNMNGDHRWVFGHLTHGRGTSIDEAIDNEIEFIEEQND
jgi:hypothetical protein